MNFLLKVLVLLACSVIYFSCSEKDKDLITSINSTYTLLEKDGSSFVTTFSLKGLEDSKPFLVTLSPEQALEIGEMLKRNIHKVALEVMHDVEVVVHPKEGNKDNGITISATGVNFSGDNLLVAIHFGPSSNMDKASNSTGTDGPGPYEDWATHTCTGAPCSCCGFSKRGNGTIKGCFCADGETGCLRHMGELSKCNHTVSG